MSTESLLHTRKRQRVAQAVRELVQIHDRAGGALPSERDMARQVGVSRNTLRTVLQALEGEGEIPVNRRGSRQVRPLPMASTLTDTVALIGDVTSELIPEGGVTSGWVVSVQAGVMAALDASPFHLLALKASRMQPERLERLVHDRPAGVILFYDVTLIPGGLALLDTLRKAGIPVVVMGDAPTLAEYDRVDSDHEAGGYALARALIARGSRRVQRFWAVPGRIGEPWPAWLTARDTGVQRALREAGLAIPAPIELRYPANVHLEQPTQRERFDHVVRMFAGYLAQPVLGRDRPDTIMAISDGEALQVAAACRLLGAEPGRDILVTGYDNYWLQAPNKPFEPTGPAFTVDKRNFEIGRELAGLLQARINGTLPADPQRRLIQPRLVMSPADVPSAGLVS